VNGSRLKRGTDRGLSAEIKDFLAGEKLGEGVVLVLDGRNHAWWCGAVE